MDEHVTWNYHTAELCKKLSRTTGSFFKVRHYAPLPSLVSHYDSIFLSVLNHDIASWGLTYES